MGWMINCYLSDDSREQNQMKVAQGHTLLEKKWTTAFRTVYNNEKREPSHPEFFVVRVTMGYGIATNLNRKQSENGGKLQKKSIDVFVVYPMSIVERTVDGLAHVMLMDVSSLITDCFMTLPKTGNQVSTSGREADPSREGAESLTNLTMTSNRSKLQPEATSLRTVPVWVKANGKKAKVN
jgi:hypothetical protein